MSSVHLNSNEIKHLPPRFLSSRYLFELVLSFNKLQHIDPEAFAEVRTIMVLRLDNNLLKEIPLAVYNLDVAQSLIISMNFIDLISHPNISIVQSSPEKLIIAKNEIQSISRNYFSGLKSLEQIFIYLNKISYIEDGSFSGTSLTYLYIYGNLLQKVTSGMFKVNTGSLKYLYLFNNPIEDMDQGWLSYLAPNSSVYLECVNLNYIPSNIAEHTNANTIHYYLVNITHFLHLAPLQTVQRGSLSASLNGQILVDYNDVTLFDLCKHLLKHYGDVYKRQRTSC
ncbi:podocan-like [Anneissia japonica]|uniref:podocan-like n=1 Tax=Anneissia japonica TaxID=1529436 RepID=UPI0014257B90|nr:podocan-like [Anneissia japonica]